MRKFKNETGLNIKEYIINQKRIDLFFSILMNQFHLFLLVLMIVLKIVSHINFDCILVAYLRNIGNIILFNRIKDK